MSRFMISDFATLSGARYVNDTLFAGGGVLSVVGDGQGMVIMFK